MFFLPFQTYIIYTNQAFSNLCISQGMWNALWSILGFWISFFKKSIIYSFFHKFMNSVKYVNAETFWSSHTYLTTNKHKIVLWILLTWIFMRRHGSNRQMFGCFFLLGDQVFSKCGPGTSSVDSTWGLARHTSSQVSLQTHDIRQSGHGVSHQCFLEPSRGSSYTVEFENHCS
jgi:hypothetical protein